MKLDHLKQYYMTIFSVGYSPCGNYLVAGNSYGKIAIFNISPFFELEEDFQPQDEQKKPFYQFSAHGAPIYSMLSTDKLVLSGSVGEISTWKWNDLKRKENKLLFSLCIPQGSNLTKAEVNSMAMSSKENENILYAGCGDNNIYCFDIEAQAIKFVLQGHNDYIHCLILGNGNQECISGSEDGSVRIWDDRKSGSEAQIIEPYKHKMSARPQFGKWIGCIAFDEGNDWLVCGGAPNLCTWHVRFLAPATAFLKQNTTSNVVHFHDDMIISGGSEPFVNHWSFDGELLVEVPTSASSVYDISISSASKNQILSAAGSSYKIDLCRDFRFKDFSLSFS